MRNRKGFTLVEIMIVVAIIALLVAIAVPNIAAQRRIANNSAAAGNLRSLLSVLETYNTAEGEYPAALSSLTDGTNPYISTVPTGTAGGYVWTSTPATTGYTLQACPSTTSTGIYCWRIRTGGIMERCSTSGTSCSTYTTQY